MYHLRYVGEEVVSLAPNPLMVEVTLVRHDGSAAPTGSYLVDINDDWALDESEVLAVHDAQHLPFSSKEFVDLPPGALLGTATSPLLCAQMTSLVRSEKQEAEKVAAMRNEENSSPKEDLGKELEPKAGDGELPATLRDCVSPAKREWSHALWLKTPPHVREVEELPPEIEDGELPATLRDCVSPAKREWSHALWLKTPPHVREVEELPPEIGDGELPATLRDCVSPAKREWSHALWQKTHPRMREIGGGPLEIGDGEPSAMRMDCFSHAQRDSFLVLWQTIPPHMREVRFSIEGDGRKS